MEWEVKTYADQREIHRATSTNGLELVIYNWITYVKWSVYFHGIELSYGRCDSVDDAKVAAEEASRT